VSVHRGDPLSEGRGHLRNGLRSCTASYLRDCSRRQVSWFEDTQFASRVLRLSPLLLCLAIKASAQVVVQREATPSQGENRTSRFSFVHIRPSYRRHWQRSITVLAYSPSSSCSLPHPTCIVPGGGYLRGKAAEVKRDKGTNGRQRAWPSI
jgi:hypothetical protein